MPLPPAEWWATTDTVYPSSRTAIATQAASIKRDQMAATQAEVNAEELSIYSYSDRFDLIYLGWG